MPPPSKDRAQKAWDKDEDHSRSPIALSPKKLSSSFKANHQKTTSYIIYNHFTTDGNHLLYHDGKDLKLEIFFISWVFVCL